eukprot:gene6118-6357_t
MGCGGSKPEMDGRSSGATPKGAAADSMIAGMTMGELKDFQCPHNARIEAALAGGRAELETSKTRSVWDDYEADTELIGRGAFARVFKAIRREDQQPVAIKVIGRDTKAFKQQRRAMVTKIAVMRTLMDHPNMLKLHGIFEDEEGFHVVLEYCKGAPLLDAIHDKGHFTEAQAAHVMRQLLEFLAFAHETCNVVHRDIKPENLLLLDADAPQCQAMVAAGKLTPAEQAGDGIESMLLKVIDYGTAGFCEPGQHLHSKVGTARYVAPEVLNQDYDRLSDIWSAGVVMYILLCGRPPFKGSTETGTLRQVKAGTYKFADEVWTHVHDSAKDMLAHMMVVDPSQRWTARQLLNHPWFDEVSAAPARPLTHVVSRLGAFTGAARMKRLALKLMVAAAGSSPGALQNQELNRLRSMFQEMDLDKDGIISGQQLQAGLASLGTDLTEQDIAEFLLVSKVDCHSEGINFNEFIAAMFDAQKLAHQQQQQLIEREFAELDMDHDGYITAEDLVAASRAGIRLQARTKPAAGGKTGSIQASSSPTASSAAEAGSNVELAPVADSMSAVLHEVVHAALGSELTLAEAAAMLDEVDQKHQGKISLAEMRFAGHGLMA